MLFTIDNINKTLIIHNDTKLGELIRFLQSLSDSFGDSIKDYTFLNEKDFKLIVKKNQCKCNNKSLPKIKKSSGSHDYDVVNYE